MRTTSAVYFGMVAVGIIRAFGRLTSRLRAHKTPPKPGIGQVRPCSVVDPSSGRSCCVGDEISRRHRTDSR